MTSWVRKSLSVGVLAFGALLFAPGAAHADVSPGVSGTAGVTVAPGVSGTVGVAVAPQADLPVGVPTKLCGNSLAALGLTVSTAACTNDAGTLTQNLGAVGGLNLGNLGNLGGVAQLGSTGQVNAAAQTRVTPVPDVTQATPSGVGQ